MIPLTAFKAYDIRGIIGDDLTDEMIPYIGEGIAHITQAKTIAIGHDVRETSPHFAQLLTSALTRIGVTVYNLGLSGTEETYFASFNGAPDGTPIEAGIMVTASHNPIEYNGMKIVRHNGLPFSADEDMPALKNFVAENMATNTRKEAASTSGQIIDMRDKSRYISNLLSYINVAALKPLKIVVNAGNGCAGPVVDLLEKKLPFELIKAHNQPDGTFPNGIPNPLLPENREATTAAIRQQNADFGVAWDGDFDRCFVFDHEGNFVSNYYLLSLLAKYMLTKTPGAAIVYDPRLVWNTVNTVTQAGGKPIACKVGHGYFKKVMRAENAIFGGEVSGHFYFKDFACCDSGMIPFLIVAQMLSQSDLSLKDMVAQQQSQFPASDESNRPLAGDVQQTLAHIEAHYAEKADNIDKLDGLSIAFDTWRFNVRPSSNEPLLRLNVEAKDSATLTAKETEVAELIQRCASL